MERIRTIVRLVAALAMTSAVVGGAPTSAQDTSPIGAYFTPTPPCRLLDTRTGATSPHTSDGPETVWRVQTVSRCGTPTRVAAVALTVTTVRATGDGFLTVQSAGTRERTTSNLNYRPARAVANTVIVAPSPEGAVDIRTTTAVDVLVDINGVFVETEQPVAAGRLVPVEPRRILDSRTGGAIGEGIVQRGVTGYGAGDVDIDLSEVLPDDGAIAVAVTVTAADSEPGFLSAHPTGASRPQASILNLDAHDPTRATTTLLPLSDDGLLTVFRSAPGHLIVDLWGYFTGPSAAVSADGLFVPESPVRVWDSRVDGDPLHPGGRLTRPVAPAAASVAALNITSVGATGDGYLTVGAAGQPRPATSNLNYRWTEPVAAATLVRNTTAGVTFWSHAGSHVIVDRLGWFTGGAADAVAEPDRNPMPSAGGRVLFVSDSSFAGIRWNGALGWLQGADFDARLESCRRLIGVSCRGREGYAPPTALREVRSVVPGTVDVLVVGTGYNDSGTQFRNGFEQVMTAARAARIERVVWITYREPVTYRSPSQLSNAATFTANNRVLREALASGAWPELHLLDWDAHSWGMDRWVASDGVHFTVEGAREAALFVTRALAHYDRRPCGTVGGHSEPGGWCADPTGLR